MLLIVFCNSNASALSTTSEEQQQDARGSSKLDATKIYELASQSVVVINVVDSRGSKSFGSGVIVRGDGFIATNFHVINGAISARVQLHNSDIFDEVTIIDSDARKDIAILKIRAQNLPSLELANSEDLKIGATVYSLGAPLGLEGSLSQGLVSSIRPVKELNPEIDGFRVIQFTAPASKGNSGGPLLDEFGRVVALVTANIPAGQNLNFAIPSNYILGLLSNPPTETKTLAKSSIGPDPTPIRPPNEILASAKTIYIHIVQGNPVLEMEITNKIVQWAKLSVVSTPAEADLILEVAQVGKYNGWTGEGAQAAAALKERVTGSQLWYGKKGGSWAMSGFSIAKVGRAIGDELVKFLDTKIKTSSPKSK